MKRKSREITPEARTKLAEIATRAIPREVILDAGFRSLVASTDLHHCGYQIRHWWRLSDGAEVIEYHSRWERSGLPRLTATTYAEQVEIHLALGLNIVQPGEKWVDYGQQGLFDTLAADPGKT